MSAPCPNKLADGRACGDEGEVCDACAELEIREYGWLQHVSKYAAGLPLDENYYADMRDAGRIA